MYEKTKNIWYQKFKNTQNVGALTNKNAIGEAPTFCVYMYTSN